LAQVGEVAQEHKWAVLQGWLRRQAPTPLLVVFENAEDSVHLEVGAGGRKGFPDWAVVAHTFVPCVLNYQTEQSW
jgi:hypothetical protein